MTRDRDTIWNRILSKSYVARQTPDVQDALKQQIYAVLEEEFGAPKDGELIDFQFETNLRWTRKRSINDAGEGESKYESQKQIQEYLALHYGDDQLPKDVLPKGEYRFMLFRKCTTLTHSH
jgi:hypothetical protein